MPLTSTVSTRAGSSAGGTGTRVSAAIRTWVAQPPVLVTAATRVPIQFSRPPEPTARTVPTRWYPGTKGNDGAPGYRPRRICCSANDTPVASTFTSAWPAAGAGSVRCLVSNPEGSTGPGSTISVIWVVTVVCAIRVFRSGGVASDCGQPSVDEPDHPG